MSGHSKWANIKHRKMAQDAKKGQAYGKFTREIIMAAKLGGGDPAGNFRLRTAMDRAKAAGLPNDTIDRAIAKGTGQGGADSMEQLTYEGYGPGGVALYVQAMTDNRNRTAGDVRSTFSKYGGNLGETGCVGWMFKETGRIVVSTKGSKGDLLGNTEDFLMEISLDAGAEDIAYDASEGICEIFTPPDALNTVCQGLQINGVKIESAEMTRIPENTIPVTSPEQAKPLLKLLDILEGLDDVQNVYANFEMDDALIDACAPS